MNCTTVACVGLCVFPIFGNAASGQDEPEAQVQSELPVYATLHDGSENKDAISSQEAMWGLFMLIRSHDDQEPRSSMEFLKNGIGLDDGNAEALLKHIRLAHDELQDYSNNLVDEKCRHLKDQTTRAEITGALSDVEQLVDLRRETIVSDIAHILDSASQQKVSNWAEQNIRPNLKLITFDHAIAVEGIPPNVMVDRMCGS